MGESAPFGRAAKRVLLFRMVAMQRVVEPRHHPRRIAERRVLGDVFDALAVDPYLSAVVEAVEKFLAGVGKQCRHSYGLPEVAKMPARDCFAALAMTAQDCPSCMDGPLWARRIWRRWRVVWSSHVSGLLGAVG